MPYIKQEDRPYLDPVAELMIKRVKKPGDIPYILQKYGLSITPKFINYAKFFGSLILFMFEFYRRVIAKYENSKIRENGDVTK